MGSRIVSDGGFRLVAHKDFKMRRAMLWRIIREKHALELSSANPFVKGAAWFRARREFNREWAKVSPSPHSLFSTKL